MSITVATVALNAAADLPQTLESALLQDHDDLEVLVLDGASTDATADVLARYAGAVRVLVEEDSGIFDAMNRAAAAATKEFVVFMNAGDRFYSAGSLSKLWRRRHSGVDVVYGKHVYRSEGVDTLKAARDMGVHVAALRAGLVSWEWLDGFPVHQATLTRAELLRRLRFDGAFRMAADHDLLMRAYDGGAAMQYVDEIVCVYAGGGISDRRRELTARELNAIYRARSERPDQVDELFFPDGSPFKGMRSPYAGDVVAGLLPDDPALAERLPEGTSRFVGGRGLRLRTPIHRPVDALTLSGFNQIPGQVLEAFAHGKRVLRKVLGAGPFELELEFETLLAPGTLIDLTPQAAVRVVGRGEVVSLALAELGFRFVEALRPLAAGARFETTATGGRAVAVALVGGWWAPERTHVWSKKAGELRLSCDDEVGEVAVTAFANPALAGQSVALFVNGREVGAMTLAPQPATHVFAGVAGAWRGNGAENRLRFVPSEVGRVGADPRHLGFGLCSVMLS